MTTVDSILTGPSGPFVHSLAGAASDALPVDVVAILDPRKTPSRFLPWLAAHEGVRLWFDDWSEERKREIVADWTRLASIIGTKAAAAAFLAYVDTVIVHRRTYPSRFPVGRMAAALTPIQFPTFSARYLLKAKLRTHRRALCQGRSAVGLAAAIGVPREPLIRAKSALVASTAPETAQTVTFAHRTLITLDDGFDLAAPGGARLGSFRDRTRL